MIKVKRKLFGLGDFISRNIGNRKISTPNTVKPRIEYISFKELENLDPYPAIITLRLKELKTENELKQIEDMLKNIGLIGMNNFIENVYILSDNVNGKSGANAMCLKFSPDTKINSGVRLKYRDKMKWPEDFFQNNRDWYKSGNTIRKSFSILGSKYSDIT